MRYTHIASHRSVIHQKRTGQFAIGFFSNLLLLALLGNSLVFALVRQAPQLSASRPTNSIALPVPARPAIPPGNNRPLLKSGYIPPVCLRFANSEQLVDCWLSQYPTIAKSIVWWFQGDSDGKDWTQWDEAAKQQLRTAVKNAATWYQGGMTSYPGTLVQDPPPNLTDPLLAAGQPAYVIFAKEDAWGIYLGNVGLSLAAELYAFVPWSLRNYDATSLHHLFNAVRGKLPFDDGTKPTRFWPSETLSPESPPGYINWGIAPANATYIFKFLKDNNLLGASPKETIANLLQWSQQLAHHIGNNGSLNSYNHWQYYGGPTVSRVIEGTLKLDDTDLGIRHWTRGCGGTSAFLVAVLRAANIPAMPATVGAGNDTHATIWFSAEKSFLSHGDDPYDRTAGGYPAAELLISEQTFFDWFINLRPSLAILNIARRPLELGIQYPGSGLLNDYCKDVQSGADHASGKVYNLYSRLAFAGFSVTMLEEAGLWDNLKQKAVATGTCDPDAY